MGEYSPYIVSWNLTQRCNLSCPHCYMDSSSTAQTIPSELSRSEAKLVIDELSGFHTPLMLVLSGGEPMLREDIFDIVGHASQAGFITVLGSNGLLLGYENLRRLKEAGLRGVGISVDSVEARWHDRFRGLEGSWDSAIHALRSAKVLGMETQMDVTLTDENIGQIGEFIDLAASLSAKAVSFFFLVCTGRAMKTKVSGFNYEDALKRIARVSQAEKRLMVKARCAPHIYRLLYEQGGSLPDGTRGCLAGRHYMRIDPQGNITPCPYLPGSVGNVREAPLTTLWDEATSLRQLRAGNYRGRCGICEYAEICGGCRARALADKGDLLAEDPLCTYKPTGKMGGPELGVQSGPLDEPKTLPSELRWDDRARERIKKVPPFMKGMIIKMIEARAKERGIDFITSEFIGEMKSKSGLHGPS